MSMKFINVFYLLPLILILKSINAHPKPEKNITMDGPDQEVNLFQNREESRTQDNDIPEIIAEDGSNHTNIEEPRIDSDAFCQSTVQGGVINAVGENFDCKWTIRFKQSSVLELTTLFFNLENCETNFLAIQLGTSTPQNGPSSYCNERRIPTFVEIGGNVTIRLQKSDNSPTTGWIAFYRTVPLTCCTQIVSNDATQVLNAEGTYALRQSLFNNRPSFRNNVNSYFLINLPINGVYHWSIGFLVNQNTVFRTQARIESRTFCPENSPLGQWITWTSNNQFQSAPNLQISCATRCSAPPTITGTTNNFAPIDGGVPAGTEVTYTCTATGQQRFIRCRKNGGWSGIVNCINIPIP